MENEKLIPVHKHVEIRCPKTGGEWVTTSIWYHPIVVLESYANHSETKRFEKFADLFKYCETYGIRNCEEYHDWLKRPTISVNNATTLTHHYLHERGFKWFEVRVTYEPHPEWSMDFLRKKLHAEDFADLCKNRGWKIF